MVFFTIVDIPPDLANKEWSYFVPRYLSKWFYYSHFMTSETTDLDELPDEVCFYSMCLPKLKDNYDYTEDYAGDVDEYEGDIYYITSMLAEDMAYFGEAVYSQVIYY